MGSVISGLAANWYLEDRKQTTENTEIVEVIGTGCGHEFNSKAFDALEWRKPILDSVIEALADPNTHLIGVYGSDDDIKDTLLQRVCRKVERDKLLDVVLTVTITKKLNVS